ncbi:MAG: hypothetical protein R3F55_21640 [Alphaproteobacteria bacterium]
MNIWRETPTGLKVGLVAGLIPFVFNISFLSTSSAPAAPPAAISTSPPWSAARSRSWPPAAMLQGRGPMVEVRTAPVLRYGLGIVVAALGALQVLRGFGILFGPCN